MHQCLPGFHRDVSFQQLSPVLICDDADCKLLAQIAGNSRHLLHPLLFPEREQHYSRRDRSHN